MHQIGTRDTAARAVIRPGPAVAATDHRPNGHGKIARPLSVPSYLSRNSRGSQREATLLHGISESLTTGFGTDRVRVIASIHPLSAPQNPVAQSRVISSPTPGYARGVSCPSVAAEGAERLSLRAELHS